jgi:ureidoacrylate peracid hydrolase
MITELIPRPESHLIMKKSYGGFFRTDLDSLLKKLKVKTLFLTGVATNFCVETTAREAVGYGYGVVMVSDATATYTEEGHQASLTVIGSGFGEIMTSEEVIKTLSD